MSACAGRCALSTACNLSRMVQYPSPLCSKQYQSVTFLRFSIRSNPRLPHFLQPGCWHQCSTGPVCGGGVVIGSSVIAMCSIASRHRAGSGDRSRRRPPRYRASSMVFRLSLGACRIDFRGSFRTRLPFGEAIARKRILAPAIGFRQRRGRHQTPWRDRKHFASPCPTPFARATSA